jgi:acetate kinase
MYWLSMNKFLIVINAGSSSVKFAIYQLDSSAQLSIHANGQIEGIGNQATFMVTRPCGEVVVDSLLADGEVTNHKEAITKIHSWLLSYIADGRLLAIGHRIVHGGQNYSAPVLITSEVLKELETLIPLAPLHQPHNLAAIHAFHAIMPALPQVACFDTAFHHTQAVVVQRFALPRHFFDEGVRRYGFHGLSYEYIVSILPDLDQKLLDARVIIAHLGSGASLCAIHKGRSIATTMGFSPLDGLVMGTRCGSLDPGVILYLMEHHRMQARELEHLLYYESGLLGVSGISDDMRTLLASGDVAAQEAITMFVYRIGREIGSLVAALSGLDALIFTGGIGEHSAEIRSRICLESAWLGLQLDEVSNQAGKTLISSVDSKISAWVAPANENLVIAKHTLNFVGLSAENYKGFDAVIGFYQK